MTEPSGAEPAQPATGGAGFTLVDLSIYAIENADITALIADYPLAWVLPRCADAGQPHLLPLLARTDAEGRVVTLIGHMGRRNPLVAAFEQSPEALILFTGPQGYVSNGNVTNPRWAPTWNYAQLRIEARITLEPAGGDAALRELVEAMDAEEQTGWRPADVGPRYRAMEQAIIAFRADVTRIEPRFKLGQDENVETLREILDRHPDPTLVRWMKRINRKRLEASGSVLNYREVVTEPILVTDARRRPDGKIGPPLRGCPQEPAGEQVAMPRHG